MLTRGARLFVVLIGLVISVNLLSIGFRVYLRARKRW